MADRIRINIQLGEVKHPLNVDRDTEPIFREAARMVNERLAVYAEKYRGARLPQEYLMSFAALDVAAQYVRLNRAGNSEAVEAELEALVAEWKQFLG